MPKTKPFLSLRTVRALGVALAKRPPTPTLDRLLREGKIWFDGGTIRGKATDGTIVNIGESLNPEGTEAYLSRFPNPSDW